MISFVMIFITINNMQIIIFSILKDKGGENVEKDGSSLSAKLEQFSSHYDYQPATCKYLHK